MEIDRINKYCHVSAYIAYDNCSPVYKQKIIIKDLENSFLSFEKFNDVEFTSHPADKSGKSVANGIYLDLPSGDTAMVECYIWSKEYKKKHGGHKDNLRVTLSNKDGNDFVNNEAFN